MFKFKTQTLRRILTAKTSGLQTFQVLKALKKLKFSQQTPLKNSSDVGQEVQTHMFSHSGSSHRPTRKKLN